MSDYIPMELIPNILARLQVDDVLRCTSVCKSWYKLIISPSFATQHLKLSSPNQEPRLLVRYCNNEKYDHVNSMHRDSSFDEIAMLDGPPDHPDPGNWEIIDSLNGIVCLFNGSLGKITLWNPSLRKSLILPDPAVLPVEKFPHGCTIGFGFLATTNEYKIVYYDYFHKTGPEAEVYQLSTGSWHYVQILDSSIVRLASPQAHLKGILHWFTRPNVGDIGPIPMICSFDLENEEFGTLMMPSIDFDNYENFRLCTFRESLCLIDEVGMFCKVWIMKEYGVGDSWEKLFIIDKGQHRLSTFLDFRDNGEILFQSAYSYHYTKKSELIFYDCETNQVKNPGSTKFGHVHSVHSYVDSLAFLIKASNDPMIEENISDRALTSTSSLLM